MKYTPAGIYRLTKHLLCDSGATSLPNGGTPKKLALHFSNVLTKKIYPIRHDLHSIASPVSQLPETPADVSEPLVTFAPASQVEVRAIIKKSPHKSCELDPVQTSLLN